MSSKILMLRHGITEGNKNRWFYGALDLPLLPEGREALLMQKEEGIYPPIPEGAKFYTTGKGRTLETLETLFGERPHEVIKDLREMEFGEYEGHSFDEPLEDPGFQEWLNDETGNYTLPGGESRNQFNERVLRGTEELISRHMDAKPRDEENDVQSKSLEESGEENEEMSVVICHGGVICAIMDFMFSNEKEDMWQWMVEPGSGYLVEIENGSPINYMQIGKNMVYY